MKILISLLIVLSNSFAAAGFKGSVAPEGVLTSQGKPVAAFDVNNQPITMSQVERGLTLNFRGTLGYEFGLSEDFSLETGLSSNSDSARLEATVNYKVISDFKMKVGPSRTASYGSSLEGTGIIVGGEYSLDDKKYLELKVNSLDRSFRGVDLNETTVSVGIGFRF